MAKYLIHACTKRIWYVERYLVPTLIQQGISESDIYVYLGTKGNLIDFMESCEKCLDVFGENVDVWHLQDDVLPCSDFKERTEQEYDADIICGFTCDYGEDNIPVGKQLMGTRNMWWSFPCIRIPNAILATMVKWQYPHLWRNPYFREYRMRNCGDDWVFREYASYYYPDAIVYNMAPMLVEHIDYLLGGSVVSPKRDKDTRGMYWEDEASLNRLKNFLEKGVDIHYI